MGSNRLQVYRAPSTNVSDGSKIKVLFSYFVERSQYERGRKSSVTKNFANKK
jgi:hypothetical protein